MKSLRNIILALALFVPMFAVAQALPDPVQYAVAPETPGPNSPVSIEIGGVGSFLGNATITWKKDGAVVLQDTGATRYNFTTNAIGKATIIDITIQSPTQGTIAKQLVFNPSAVNLVWEADTTVPPFYKGKALYSAGSPLRVVAMPVVLIGGSRVAASALSYQWSVNDQLLSGASGLGRSTLSFVGDQLNNSEVASVDVYYGAAKVARGEVVVPAVTPQLVLYERDPLRGLILDIAFPSTINLLGKEMTVQAVPFYFSNRDSANGSLQYAWLLNGQDATGPDADRGILTLRQTGSGTGAAQIEVSLQDYNSDTFIQNASAALTLLFGTSGSVLSNLFGL